MNTFPGDDATDERFVNSLSSILPHLRQVARDETIRNTSAHAAKKKAAREALK